MTLICFCPHCVFSDQEDTAPPGGEGLAGAWPVGRDGQEL